MKITRNILSILCILYGSVTLIGYFLVILPKGTSSLFEVVFSLAFAVLFILGGIMAILKNNIAIPALISSCVIYAFVGLYKPLQLHGFGAFNEIHQQFYISLFVRCSIVIVLSIILIKQKNNHAKINT